MRMPCSSKDTASIVEFITKSISEYISTNDFIRDDLYRKQITAAVMLSLDKDFGHDKVKMRIDSLVSGVREAGVSSEFNYTEENTTDVELMFSGEESLKGVYEILFPSSSSGSSSGSGASTPDGSRQGSPASSEAPTPDGSRQGSAANSRTPSPVASPQRSPNGGDAGSGGGDAKAAGGGEQSGVASLIWAKAKEKVRSVRSMSKDRVDQKVSKLELSGGGGQTTAGGHRGPGAMQGARPVSASAGNGGKGSLFRSREGGGSSEEPRIKTTSKDGLWVIWKLPKSRGMRVAEGREGEVEVKVEGKWVKGTSSNLISPRNVRRRGEKEEQIIGCSDFTSNISGHGVDPDQAFNNVIAASLLSSAHEAPAPGEGGASAAASLLRDSRHTAASRGDVPGGPCN
jgi:hypothetical protein